MDTAISIRPLPADIKPIPSSIIVSINNNNNSSSRIHSMSSNLSALLPKTTPILPLPQSASMVSASMMNDGNGTDHDVSMADDDSSLRRRRISPAQLAVLRRVYNERTKYPVVALRNELAEKLGLRPRMVQVWFQNQRQQEATKRREQERDRERRVFEREHARMHQLNINANHAASRLPLPHPIYTARPMSHPMAVVAPAVASMPLERVPTTPADHVITHCDGSRHPPPLARTADGRIIRGFPVPVGFVPSDVFRPWSYESAPSWRNSEPPTAKNSRRRRRVTVSGGDTPMSPIQPMMGTTHIMRTRTAERPLLEDTPIGLMNAGIRRRPRRSSGPARPPWVDHLPGDARISTLTASLAPPVAHHQLQQQQHQRPTSMSTAYMSPSIDNTASACTDPYCRSCPPKPASAASSFASPMQYHQQQQRSQHHPSTCQGPCCHPSRYARVNAHPSPPYGALPPPPTSSSSSAFRSHSSPHAYSAMNNGNSFGRPVPPPSTAVNTNMSIRSSMPMPPTAMHSSRSNSISSGPLPIHRLNQQQQQQQRHYQHHPAHSITHGQSCLAVITPTQWMVLPLPINNIA
ncbi:hypothetical protein BDF19DRAFT_421029 [Syncephalis fuscata]|nr:hypothetical protein BDF19DRAFT_421029 [Syncephalis fuscata]